MEDALYGQGGFFVTGAPAAHFRTSVHASPLFASAILRLLCHVDDALGRPERLDVVDVGAGRGELLATLLHAAPPELAGRLALTGVERAPRPPSLPTPVTWASTPPTGVTGLLLATEWLDNVPLDVVEGGRYVAVDRSGAESPGAPACAADLEWLTRWWPGAPRAEVGAARDRAWAGAVATVERGLALAVDYGHLRGERPLGGTLTGYRAGRQVPPVPDGTCDITAHVAMDSVAEAAGKPYTLVSQREALHALGVDGARPPLARASTDPAGYVRALAAASAAAELTDRAGLGGHWWLIHPIGVDPPPLGNVGR
ncbi:SAM-dependent methyltransferase [Phytohabitans sp. ZYX-F-186]|uniref:SAM-dependent methyltransferase n=1 Tax=Phytohabitans maris TaxID=3071409 RepID=A0ABU0ZIS7_9ACTN|nr:SAM-dependent methyltransferase [Phytohabitans sp. ZYX-F-186]MDQ7906956.1 SAM-dependent methyltransferase [Phytohabitans sp. ZYX-F-186]